MNRSTTAVLLFGVLFAASGATCYRNSYNAEPYAPVAFTAPPTLADIIFSVNANTDRVQQLHSDSAWLSVTGLPALRTTISLEPPDRFRLRAKLIGPEIDLGSNEEVFWFWAKKSPEPAIYYARRDQFGSNPAAAPFPVDPHWLLEAFGLVMLAPGDAHEGPFSRPDGNFEVRSRIPSPAGELTRVLVIDSRYGWILEQHLFDARGQLLATSRTTGHRFYEAYSVSLPHHVAIEIPAAKMSLQIDVSEFLINQIYDDPATLWAMPVIEGYTPVNLSAPHATATGVPRRPGVSRPTARRQARAAMSPTYRGYTQMR